MIFEYIKAEDARSGNCVKRTDSDGSVWFIPTDPANSDYQAYLATLATESAIPQAPTI